MSKKLPLILIGGLPRSGKTTFARKLVPLLKRVQYFNEQRYVSQMHPHRLPYALKYAENARYLIEKVMIKCVARAAYYRSPVLVESNYFVDYKLRNRYKRMCLTPDHELIYVSVYVPEFVRQKNNILGKYVKEDNEMFIDINKPPRPTWGISVMTPKEVLKYINDSA